MIKYWIAAGTALLVLSGCTNTEDDEENVLVVEETEDEEAEELVSTPTISSPDNYFRNVLEDGTYQRSEARGSTAHAMNNRIDIDHFERGMMEAAAERFDPDDYFFQEGNYLSGEILNSWLRRFEPSQEDEDIEEIEGDAEDGTAPEQEVEESAGLNPPLADAESEEDAMRGNPLVLSNIQEHNYYIGSEEEGVELGGVVIGLSVRNIYYFRTETEDGLLNFHEEPVDEEFALEYAQDAAGTILQRLRGTEELEEVPVTFAIFREEPRGSVEPGTFRMMSHVGEGENNIQGWEGISESNLVFPSSEARDQQPQLADEFTSFREDVEHFFDEPLGVIGRARYKDNSLHEFDVEINIQSHGMPEVIALTQFISGQLEDAAFSGGAPLHISISSVEGNEAVIVQHPNQEPFVHIY
ncbi:CamS family sex pheromone protein [Alkalicoccus chagannorensis]|uniref:CamS family sex pheromone protein n=1 Tax=Alkalicoccus chagannorensis TaxID=427072 RepID=UPI000426DFA9|nr:CamS family sex pheromone protein [Alkalicoccus chagannorensis]